MRGPFLISILVGLAQLSSAEQPKPLSQAIWIRSNEAPNVFPESPPETPANTEDSVPPITTTQETSTEESVKVGLRTQDLSKDYLPSYCQCVSRQYCPAAQRSRPKRAVNTPQCRGGQVMCCYVPGPGCGVVDPFPNFYPNPSYGEASFAEYPWTALILDSNNEYIYGTGIVISWNLILTSARNIQPHLGKRFKVLLGEWDLASNVEPFVPEEYAVNEVRLHPSYNQRTLQNDLALLRINSTANLDIFPHIRSACLARPGDSYKYSGAKCVSAGWGLKPNTRIVPGRNLLKEVDLQILDPPVCQKVVRSAIQNPEYYWDQESFLCAGGQPEKGLCKGDEGAALICQDTPSSRLVIVGVSSWLNSCGEPGFPSVFTNMANYYDWIKSVDPNIGQ